MEKGAFAYLTFAIQGADGGFLLEPSKSGDPTKIRIDRLGGPAAGEGGDFDAGALLMVLEKFYNEHF